jgi:hypothetical protein
MNPRRGRIKNMLEVKLLGRLGNQMFQYAFSLYLKSGGNDVYIKRLYELEKVFHIKARYFDHMDWAGKMDCP